jgi:hypothetical protein
MGYPLVADSMVILWWFNGDLMGFTWQFNIAIENGHRNSGFTQL